MHICDYQHKPVVGYTTKRSQCWLRHETAHSSLFW